MPNAGTVSALLLLALASGFVFAYRWERTRYLSLRSEGQQLYLLAAVFAIPLVLASRILLWLMESCLPVTLSPAGFLSSSMMRMLALPAFPVSCPPIPLKDGTERVFADIAGPLYGPALSTFIVAFVLGLTLPFVLNALSNRDDLSDWATMRYGSELEKFLFETQRHKLPVSVSLENRKVYVGYPWTIPPIDPRRIEDYAVRLLPMRSGYRDEKTMELHLTTQYSGVYRRIARGEMQGMTRQDFVVVLPVKNIVSVNLFAVGINSDLLRMTQRQPSEFVMPPPDEPEGFVRPPEA